MKKLFKNIIIIIGILLLIWLLIFSIDFYRCTHKTFPIFMIQEPSITNEVQTNSRYHGLGYEAYFSVGSIIPQIAEVKYMEMTLFGKEIAKLDYVGNKGTIIEVKNNEILMEHAHIMSTDPKGNVLIKINKKTKILTRSADPIVISDLKPGSEITVIYDEKNFKVEQNEIRNPYIIKVIN